MQDFATPVERRGEPKESVTFTVFDKVCATLSIIVGAIFMLTGAIGLFLGSNAHFRLPPILGVLPFFLGWGMCVPLVKYWKISNRQRASLERDQWNPRPDE